MNTGGYNPKNTELSKGEDMKVRIDYDLCMGDGNCHKVCPEVFDYDDDQMIGIVREETVPAEHEESVKRAADECAPGAIVLEK